MRFWRHRSGAADSSSSSCDRKRSCDGTGRDSVSSGVGNHGRRGRPRIPVSLQELIAEMARANRTWGEERIAAELLLKSGVAVSPRTVRRYMRRPVSPRPCSSPQTWSTFVRNHARETLACDFFVVAEFSSRRKFCGVQLAVF